jgi:hypothetical protein
MAKYYSRLKLKRMADLLGLTINVSHSLLTNFLNRFVFYILKIFNYCLIIVINKGKRRSFEFIGCQ